MKIRLLALHLVAFGGLATTSLAAAAPQRPNLVVILADDFGYECITANGGESYQTPNVDRLAAGGMRFERCHVQPLCTPTRVQLMTGLSNARNYIEFGAMDRRAVTFAQLLKSAGYVTGIAGKWQLGSEPDSPRHFGFDEALLWHHRSRESRYGNPGFDFNGEPRSYPPGSYGPAILNEFAIDFVSRHRDLPFFLYYPMVLTHSPYQPTPESPKWDPRTGERGNQNAENFPAMVAYLDRMVGEFMARLDSLGLRENTLVLFLGDNGTGIEITSRFKGEPYPGGKGRSHARGTHVPLIASWPGRVPAGMVNGDLIGSTDFLPTLLDAAGAKLPDGYPGDGVSFYPQLLGQKGRPRDALYAWYASDGGPVAKWEFAMSTRHKLYRDGRFFDLGSDPWEQRALKVDSLTGDSATAAKALQAELERYSDARPPELRQERVTAKQARRAEKEKRKKQ
ncbi:MAG: sulfatase-like hydrolase/transferase [Opitutaceae bacterium]